MSGIEGKELLIASHIQPWAHSEKNREARGCPDNGLLLSSLWDAAFDSGLVTFDEDWRVVSSPALSESAKKHLGLQEEKFLPKSFRNPRRAEYLAYHRAVVFKR
ncbi:Putative nuclease, HNH family [Aromatoleum petrolei]|nr:Putative nuclease, HNH family [Aromatoleum petrolei]